MSIKITPDHRDRQAYVYVRQSTADQLLHNHESRRRQYALTDRARALGWSEVVIVDDDLGRSGGGVERLDSNACCWRFARRESASYWRSRPRAWPATAGTGTRYWSSAAWWAACWRMRTGSMTRGWRTTGCCSA